MKKKTLEEIFTIENIEKYSPIEIYFINLSLSPFYDIKVENKEHKLLYILKHVNEEKVLQSAEKIYDFLKNKGYECFIDVQNLNREKAYRLKPLDEEKN